MAGFGFTGQREDTATGLDYYNARYYDASVGQFTSADTDDQGGLNRYAYVAGNPETRIDPTGHMLALFGEGGGGDGDVAYTGDNGGCDAGACHGGVVYAPPAPQASTPPSQPSPSQPSPSQQQSSDQNTKSNSDGPFGVFAKGIDAAGLAKELSERDSASRLARAQARAKDFTRHGRFAERPNAAEKARNAVSEEEGFADFLEKFGDLLIVAGFMIDWANFMISYFDANNHPGVDKSALAIRALVGGFIHAAIFTAITMGLTTAIMAAITAGTGGLAAPAAFLASGIIGFAAGWVGGKIADWATPLLLNAFAGPIPMAKSVGTA